MNQATEDTMSKAYTAAGGRNATAFPWASIIEMIMSLFGGCTLPSVAKRWAKKHPEACKEMIAAKLNDARTFSSSVDRAAAVEAAYATFLEMSDSEIRETRWQQEE